MHCRNGFNTFQDNNAWIVKNDPDIVPEEDTMIVLYGNYDMCMDNNGKDTKQTRHITRIMHLVRNG